MSKIINEDYVVESKEDLNDAFVCYCTIMRYMEEAGEDYIDYCGILLNDREFIRWMCDKGYINNEQMNHFINNRYDISDLECDEVLFPLNNGYGRCSEMKIYVLLAEYLSSSDVTRKILFDTLYDEEEYSFEGGFYKDDDDISLACKIPLEQMKSENKTFNTEELDNLWFMNYRERWDLIYPLSIEECEKLDIEIEATKGKNR